MTTTRELGRGPALTIYDGNGLAQGWRKSRALVAALQPPILQLHGWPSGNRRPIVADVRAAVPGVEVWFGIGVDGIARKVTSRAWSVAKGVAEMVALAKAARDLGAKCLVINAETYWKAHAGTPERALLEALARQAILAMAEACPELVLGFTSFDHPTFHGDFVWNAFLGPGSPIEVAFWQVYAAPGGDVIAHRGALEAREARAITSYRAALRAFGIRDDVEPDTPDDLDWRGYYQLHHVTCADTVSAAVARPQSALWAAPTRTDPQGELALRALCALWRLGYWGADAVHRYQADHGLGADGVCGPNTLRTLGIT